MLGVKQSTHNAISYGECGVIPPSVKCQISTLCYLYRLETLPDCMLVKKVYKELGSLHEQGFITTWYTKACELRSKYGITIADTEINFKSKCKRIVTDFYKSNWACELSNSDSTSILRFYKTFKREYTLEPYLSCVQVYKYRNAIAKLRCSSHTLEIERGRHCNPKLPICQRLCKHCNVIDDEMHFLFHCNTNSKERSAFFTCAEFEIPGFKDAELIVKLNLLLNSKDKRLLTLLGKFIFKSFEIRKENQT